MNSDDDAFFAAVDMDMNLIDEAEADIGRPLGDEEGVGGAIDFDEGARASHFEDERDVAGPEDHFGRNLAVDNVRMEIRLRL